MSQRSDWQDNVALLTRRATQVIATSNRILGILEYDARLFSFSCTLVIRSLLLSGKPYYRYSLGLDSFNYDFAFHIRGRILVARAGYRFFNSKIVIV